MLKTGKLEFYAEMGTEGGYYIVQDSEHISYRKAEFGIFSGDEVYEPRDTFRRGKVINSYNADGTSFTSSGPGDVSYLGIGWDDGDTDEARPSDTVFVERRSESGLIFLQTKDRLTIFERGIGSLALWDGVVDLEEQDPYAPDSYTHFGMPSHHRPQGTEPATPGEWSKWFSESRWAALER